MCDFNIDLLVDNSHSRAWLHLLNLHGISQVITEPTRVTTNSRTLIDHVVIVSNTEYGYSPKAGLSNLRPARGFYPVRRHVRELLPVF